MKQKKVKKLLLIWENPDQYQFFMDSDIKTATLKNRKTDLKEQNKRLPTIQETNAC
jgi:hypothetical protein